MPIGLLVIAGIPTTIGVCEALSAQKKANAAAKEKAKFHLTATIALDSQGPIECWCILKDGNLWIDHPSFPMPGHKFTGYYFTYPSEEKHLGLVSTIADDPPMLNWLFVDKDTAMVRHGGRQDTLGGHTIGPWYWSDDEQWLTLEGNATQFVAVQQENKKWAVALDRDGCFSKGSRGGKRRRDLSETEQETEASERETDTKNTKDTKEAQPRRRPPKWMPIMLQRRMQLGMESRYVKGANG